MINTIAADWWAKMFGKPELREQFRAALLIVLPAWADWELSVDYDPCDLLLRATRSVTECSGSMFSARGLFPLKTVMQRRGNVLRVKVGYGGPWLVLCEEGRAAVKG